MKMSLCLGFVFNLDKQLQTAEHLCIITPSTYSHTWFISSLLMNADERNLHYFTKALIWYFTYMVELGQSKVL